MSSRSWIRKTPYSSISCRYLHKIQQMKLDTIDLRILAELQTDGSLSNVELARRVHLLSLIHI